MFGPSMGAHMQRTQKNGKAQKSKAATENNLLLTKKQQLIEKNLLLTK